MATKFNHLNTTIIDAVTRYDTTILDPNTQTVISTIETSISTLEGNPTISSGSGVPNDNTCTVQGDIYTDTDTSQQYYCNLGSPSAWEKTTIVNAGGATTFSQANVSGAGPSGQGEKTGDVWFDTADQYKMYYYNGTSWINYSVYSVDPANMESGDLPDTVVYTGTLTASQVNVSGINATNITTGTLNGSNVSVTNLSASNITGGTMSVDKLSAGTMTSTGTVKFNTSGDGIYGVWINETGSHTQALRVNGTDTQDQVIYASASMSTNSHTVATFYNGATSSITTRMSLRIGGVRYGMDTDAIAKATSHTTFTGSHEAISQECNNTIGDIVCDVEIAVKKNIDDCLSVVSSSNISKQKSVVGIVSDYFGCISDEIYPSLFIKPGSETNIEPELKQEMLYKYDGYSYYRINSLGEGQINVCGEGGDLEAGDLITTSSIPGKGMRQNSKNGKADDLVRNYTVAKCRENVTFDNPEQVKMVACIYMCG